MIVKALEKGVSEEKLARSLSMDVKGIRARSELLKGISTEVAEILKDKSLGHQSFNCLRKMKAIRQLEVAELMISANNFSANYAKALLATTRATDLHKPEQLSRSTGLTVEQMAKLEREMSALSTDYKEIESSYGDDMLVLVVASGFLERMLSNRAIASYLKTNEPEFAATFESIVQSASLDVAAAA